MFIQAYLPHLGGADPCEFSLLIFCDPIRKFWRGNLRLIIAYRHPARGGRWCMNRRTDLDLSQDAHPVFVIQ
jgi:hypothetical protein